MILSNQALCWTIEGFAAGSEARTVATGHNFLHDQRPDPERSGAYNRNHSPAAPLGEAFRESHIDYLRNNVDVPLRVVPETFAPLNAAALLHPDGEQWLVRVENLTYAMNGLDTDKAAAVKAFDTAARDMKNHGGVIDRIVAWLNNRPRSGGRPRFAAFLDELAPDIEDDDWMHRLRNRLGLAHLDPVPPHSIPIALMKYTVEDVLEGLPPAERGRAVAVPSVLDGDTNPYFFPSPLESAFGRTIDLDDYANPDDRQSRLVSEILHRAFRYKPKHVFRLGLISRPIPNHPIRVLRNAHRECVSVEAKLDDWFGAKIGDHVNG